MFDYEAYTPQKKGGSRGNLFRSLAFLKQQVMIDRTASDVGSSTSVGVETPAILLVFLNCFRDIFMMPNLQAFPFFQPNFTF